MALTEGEKKQLWSSIQGAIAVRQKRIRKRLAQRYSVAGATCLLLAGTLWWLVRDHVEENREYAILDRMAKDVQHTPASGSNQVQLNLGDGKVLELDDESTITYQAESLEVSQQGAIQRRHQLAPGQAEQYHTLHVPYGKRAEVILPDGSTVWLNAGSALTFPAMFDSTERDVYLIGEGYFEVAHRSDQPFTLHTKNLNINVLGTSFNVSAYENDDYAVAQLVEGRISLQSVAPDGFREVQMKPGDKATLNRSANRLTVDENAGEPDILWRKKQLLLTRKSLPEILKKMERVYNAEIEIVGQTSEKLTFSGSLDVSKPATEVLSYLYHPGKFTITQQERRITIRRK